MNRIASLRRTAFDAVASRTSQPRWRRHLLARAALAACGVALAGGAAAQGFGGTLAPNTLPVVRGVVAGQVVINAPAPGATTPRLTIDQSSQRAIIDWRSFDIGRDAEVLFVHQQGAIASTLNRIYGADPSVIQGRLRSTGPTVDGKSTPGGQVMLINQNGILFDRGSQVNTQSLLASTLNLTLTPAQFCGGNLASCNGGAPLSAGGLITPAFSGGYDDAGLPLSTRPDGSRPGNIGIGSFGPASAAAPVLKSDSGGSVLLMASRIDNDGGLIASPDGQVVLAAGNRVWLAINDNAADITLRGFVVEVGAHQDGPNLNLTNFVRNAGELSADRGNVSIAALAINQEGRVSARTALQRNGSIYLSARTKDNAEAGALRLAPGSVTEVMPDLTDTATLPESTAYAPYRGVIRAQGGTIDSSGTLQAAGGRIGLEAANVADPAAARVYLGDGSLTSVAGQWSDVDPAKNLVTFRVTSNELKNAPDQKAGVLLGATVTVDLQQGSSILALDGYRAAVGRTVAEKAAVGGELAIGSTGSLIQRSGATLDASGGGYRLAETRTATSTLVGADGRLYDIATAPQQRVYTAQLDRVTFTDARWGQTSDITNLAMASGSLRPAELWGQAGGIIRLGSGAGLVIDGTLRGGVTIGSRQGTQAPTGATLLVGTGFQPLSLANTDSPPVTATFNAEAQRIGNVVFRERAADTLGAAFNAATPLPSARAERVDLAASQLFGPATQTALGRVETGFGAVEVNADGRIELPAAVALRGDTGATLTLRAPALDLAGDVRLPGGALTLAPQLDNGVDLVGAGLLALAERTLVRGTASLSTAGAWLNQSGPGGAAVGDVLPTSRRSATGTLASTTDGGSIALRVTDETFQTRLERGAVLDVSAGGAVDAARRVTGGRGGSLVLGTGNLNPGSADWLQADLLGHAMGAGGSLTLNLGRAELAGALANGLLPADTTRVDPRWLGAAGFGNITLNTLGGVRVAEGAVLDVLAQNFVVDAGSAVALPGGAELRAAARTALLPPAQRSGSSLTLNASAGAVQVERGAVLRTDAGGSLALNATTALGIDGRLEAPAGRIGLTLRGSELLDASPLRLGAEAVLSAAARFVPVPSDTGLVQGTVFGGGTVTLDARQSALVTAPGSRIDVSGIEQELGATTAADGSAVRAQTVAGHAGTVVLRAQRGLTLGGSMQAAGPGSAAGGSLAVELTRPDGQVSLPAQQRLVVAPSVIDAAPAAGTVTSVLAAPLLADAGFEKLRLLSEDRIEFQGRVALDLQRGLRLDAPQLTLAPQAQVSLAGSTVSVGQSLGVRTQQQDARNRLVWTRDDTLPQPGRTAAAGDGLLQISAGHVDVYGSTALSGTALTRVLSDGDVRFIGREVNFNTAQGNDPTFIYQAGALAVAGNLEFKASQLVPATRTRFEVQAQGSNAYLLVQPNGTAPTDPYSVAGQLGLQADQLVQAGTVRAPQGQIDLRAGQRLELAAGSTTSVSGAGSTVLYGGTLNGVQWRYVDGNQTNSASNPRLLDAVSPDGKQLTLRAPDVTVAAGATVDLRGGGNVLGVEFVPGNGGDVDIATAANTFAVIPRARLATMPYDTFQQLAGGRDAGSGFSITNPRDGALYDSLQVEAGGRLPAGEYVLLPTRFALLPGAFLVQLQTGNAFRNLQPGQTGSLGQGEIVVAGHRTARGTDVRESQSVGVVALPGSAIARYSDYTLQGAELLAERATRDGGIAPPAPWDAARARLLDATALSIDGRFLTASASQGVLTGRVAEIDISAPRIAIVGRADAAAATPGTLQLSSATLSALDASVLVGGTRARRGNDIDVTTTATRVSVDTGAASPVELPELMISARESIDVAAGAVLRARGADAGSSGNVLHAEASGALLRLSTAGAATVDRGSFSDTAGDLRLAAGARLEAAGSLLLDATRNTASAATLRAGGGQGGEIGLAASRISLGETDGLAPVGLVLSNADLATYAGLEAITLRAYQQIDLVGSATVGSASLSRLTLDAPLLQAQPVAGLADTRVQATTLQWLNRSIAEAAPSAGAGTLTLQADRLTLGPGAKASGGFATLALTGARTIETEGSGDLRAGGTMTLSTPVLQAGGGSDQRFLAAGSGITLSAPVATLAPAAAGSTAEPLGGRLLLQGPRVAVDTRIAARSGSITLQADAGDLVLGAAARVDASGAARNFGGQLAAVGGGSVQTRAPAGAVQMAEGAVLDVSAAAEGGEAGRWELRAAEARLAGSVLGRGAGGGVDLDLGTLPSFSELNTRLNAGGFDGVRALRLRSGDLLVAASDSVSARSVSMSADAGRIDVLGRIGAASAAGAGRVELQAATGLRLAAGSEVLAAGRDAAARGGEVRLETRSGALAFEAGATVDARAGDGGAAGAVIFGVSRDAAGTMADTLLQGRVLRFSEAALAAARAGTSGDAPASVDLEATRVVSGAEVPTLIGAPQIAAWGSEHQAFIASTRSSIRLAALTDETGSLAGARLTGATEVQAAGALTLGANWDLTNAAWRAGGLPGTLTLRAVGDLTLNQTIGAPGTPNLPATTGNAVANNTINLANHAIVGGDTWNIRLTAGADLRAADAGATMAGGVGGNLVLATANAAVRTGTGRIELAAAGDIRLANPAASIYTAGRIGATDTAVGGANRWAVDGGGISLRAGASVTGPAGTPALWVTDWLRRPRQTAAEFDRDGFLTDWWSYRPRFQQGVGTLAGGDIEVRAGDAVRDLLFALPTSGRTAVAGGTRRVEVSGGGDLVLRAGGEVDGSSVLVGRGTAVVQAGGAIGRSKPLQGYLMGASSGSTPEEATLNLQAGGDARLQSVDNPTFLGMNAGAGATGPSFHPTNPALASPSSIATTFFTYADSSAVGVLSKAGDVSLIGRLAREDNWRSLTVFNQNNLPAAATTAFPASLALLAFGGDVLGSGTRADLAAQPNVVKTYPSASASVLALAAGDVRDFAVEVSDLAPSALVTPRLNAERARLTTNGSSDFFNTGNKVGTEGKAITLGRITERVAGLPFGLVGQEAEAKGLSFDVQALEGSIVNATPAALVLPARSRVRAGQDILNPSLQLQNLLEDDLSEVRAVRGRIGNRGNGGIEIAGPGRLLLQAGGDVDLGTSTVAANGVIVGGLVATGNTRNALLGSARSARLTVIAGVPATVDLARMDSVYARLQVLNGLNAEIASFYAQLDLDAEGEAGRQAVLGATGVSALVARNPAYARFTALDRQAPEALAAYQAVLRTASLPLGGADAVTARRLLALLGREDDLPGLRAAGSLRDYLARSAAPGGTLGGEPLDAATAASFAALDARYPMLYRGAVVRRANGARLTGTGPLVFDELLATEVRRFVPEVAAGGGDIFSFQTSIQTLGGSDIDLWAPAGNAVVGLTTPNASRPIGVVSNQGGALRSVLSGDFSINQGKVLTAQGGDILIFSAQGSIDAGRGAKTSLSTPAPQRRPIFDAQGNQVGISVVIPASATGSGIQTLTSDPDGLGPASAPSAGDIYLFAPAGRIDAGEAGIRSSGNIQINAQVVLNASDIKAAGASQGVPQVPSGSLAGTLAAGGAPQNTAPADERAAKAAEQAARQAEAARQAPKATVLSVEVLGFGDRNCKEDDKECFAK